MRVPKCRTCCVSIRSGGARSVLRLPNFPITGLGLVVTRLFTFERQSMEGSKNTAAQFVNRAHPLQLGPQPVDLVRHPLPFCA
jgi:hypothetical protein